MKNVLTKSFAMLLVLLILTVPVYAFRNLGNQNGFEVENDDSNQKRELRAIWVATVYGLDYPLAGVTTESETLKKEIIEMLDNIQGMGFNTVFFQVRPAADALYPSKIFPWSKYLTGDQMTPPEDGFDPLEFIITEAHKRDIEIHPWINPYRITMKTSDLDELAYDHPARVHPEWVVAHGKGEKIRHYFNPGIPEVEKMILDGVSEILENYDVDGIHLDDYFYPGQAFNDADTYAQYGGEYADIGDWRRSNINSLIEKMYKLVKAKDENLQFGVSPFAIWANSSSNPLGSDTRGKQSYYSMYADTRGWVKAGYLDYIMPQIYWNIGYEVADYEKILNWWSDVVADTEVDLYIGQAAYRAGNTDPNSPWYGVDQLRAQVNLNRTTDNVGGYAMFRYATLVRKPELVGFMKEINR
ncbi:family 10 glycosylhydrolase [Wukongibacter baidiensis]|uniref:glycoside hydrolase family 10 protein n=1 Tax=Wukongibacter baidiensis TaxID=1723361 RepID=UPI003D7F732D